VSIYTMIFAAVLSAVKLMQAPATALDLPEEPATSKKTELLTVRQG
jgi:hypothetical protein